MTTKIDNGILTVTINHLGAEMSSVKNGRGLEFIWQADPEVWPRHAPVLFPIVGKLKNNQYRFNNLTYEMGQHGFARDEQFELLSSDKTFCTFQLKSGNGTFNKYPFEFIFQITYTLSGNAVSTSYRVVNPSERMILFGVGAHPGFNCPLLRTEKFEDYFLEFEQKAFLLTELENGLRLKEKKTMSLPNKKLSLSKELFDNDALVFENRQINAVTLRSDASSHHIKMECHGWPYFGIWSKKSCTRFICLEPWYGIADAVTSSGELLQKEGMIPLEAGKEFTCSFLTSFT